MAKLIDLTGQRFGRLVVVKRVVKQIKEQQPSWICVCDCGKEIVAFGNHLKTGNTKSCGCYRQETTKKNFKKHGLGGTKIYKVFNRWLTEFGICNEWRKNFFAFEKWVFTHGWNDTEKCRICRYDTTKELSPKNCYITYVKRKERF